MTTLEKFNRTIIEALHGKSWDEAIKLEPKWVTDENDEGYGKPVVCLSRVMREE